MTLPSGMGLVLYKRAEEPGVVYTPMIPAQGDLSQISLGWGVRVDANYEAPPPYLFIYLKPPTAPRRISKQHEDWALSRHRPTDAVILHSPASRTVKDSCYVGVLSYNSMNRLAKKVFYEHF